jgi:hypothetical protein
VVTAAEVAVAAAVVTLVPSRDTMYSATPLSRSVAAFHVSTVPMLLSVTCVAAVGAVWSCVKTVVAAGEEAPTPLTAVTAIV